MVPERWRHIEELFELVVERSPADRAVLLAQADPDIRAEVEALLAQPSSGALLDQSAADLLGEFSVAQLPTGTRLGHCRIEAMLSRGGMGPVYRAKDTKLGREVAIGVLPDSLAQNPVRLARFKLAAKPLVELDHPNIGHIYGVESRALVMELVEGETLDSLLKPGALPIELVLKYARQITDALEAAHEKGIVHRDLKPANIMVTPAGVVKVLNFGLAKALEESSAASNSALETAEDSNAGPARHATVDRATDIWAFGVVLYEMLTGRRAPSDKPVTEPDWSALPAATPLKIRNLLRRCLERDPKLRLASIGEARIAIDASQTDVRSPPAGARLDRDSSRPWFLVAALSLGAAVFGCYVFGAWIILRHSETAKLFGWEATLQNHRRIVSGVDPSGAAAGKLRNGDRLLAFNEDRRAEQIGPQLFMYFLPPGSAYTVRVWRNPAESDLTFPLNLPKRPTSGFTLSRVLGLISGMIFLLLAVFMAWIRPNYPLARLGFALFLVCSVRGLYLTLDQYVGAGMGAASVLIPALWWISENWNSGLAYHFLHRFFANVLTERLWSILLLVVYAICTLFFVVNGLWAALICLGLSRATALVSQNVTLLNVHDAFVNEFRHGFEAGALLLILGALAFGYRRVKDSDQRRRVRWFVFGSILASVPFLACAVLFLVLDSWHSTPAGSQQWGSRLDPASYSFVIVPLVLTYAVVKHRILGIEVVIRQGVRYLLAKNVLRFILLMPIVGLLLPIVRHPNRPLTDALGQNSVYLNLALLIALSVSFKYRGQLSAALDRKFFREAYDQELVLSRLIEQIAELDSLAEISALVSRQLAATMHLDSISVFYRENARSEMRLRCKSSSGPEMGPAVADDMRTLRLARESRNPLDTSDLDRAGLPTFERDWLYRMGTHLLVPIGLANQQPAGLLLMGQKRSEEPYGPADRKLLLGIAGQMAVVYERVWLREQVEADRRLRNEVLAHVDAESVDVLKECPACGACHDHQEETCSHDGVQLTHTLPVARTIDSRYRLDRRIGQGGMGAVYEAMDLRLHRKVAIKVLVGRLFGNLPALRRFEREAEACARLTHPNIIAIHDFGRIGQEGAYLVMERLYGGTLRSELTCDRTLSPITTADWFDQFLNGLQAAHNAGIAHRDLKPENVFTTRRETGGDRITILDFGLAKLRLTEAPDLESLTAPGTVMGTVGYMSPEQLSGQASDELSDLFSTGVMIFECITGTLPFKATSYAVLLRAISQDSPTVPGGSSETLRLNRLLRKCLAPNRSERFQTAREVQSELLPALRAWSRQQ